MGKEFGCHGERQEIARRYIQRLNQRSPLHAGNEAGKPGIQSGLRHIADITRSPKQDYQWLHKTDLSRPIFLKNSFNSLTISHFVNAHRTSMSLSERSVVALKLRMFVLFYFVTPD